MHTTSAYTLPRSRQRIAASRSLLAALLVGFGFAGPAPAEEFTRGNVNGVGGTDVSDAVTILTYAFLGRPAELSCQDAADVNDNGTIDLVDAVHLLDFLFVGGAAPAAPFPGCGSDPTDDGLSCDSFALCPGGVDGGLTRVPGDPNAAAAALVPEIDYRPDLALYSTEGVPGLGASIRDAIVMLSAEATVGELNELLAREGAAIVGSIPGDESLAKAVLMVRFPSSTALELFDLTERLSQDPIVEAAAPDVLVGSNVVPDDTRSAKNIVSSRGCHLVGNSGFWTWDPPGFHDGGNWGLEYARVPQMWNWNDAIQKRGAPGLITGVLDGGFPPHKDVTVSPALGGQPNPGHGLHVSGTIGATWDNDEGVDGVNPFASLAGKEMPSSAWGMTADPGAFLRAVPGIRVVNMSFGYYWTFHGPIDPAQKVLANLTAAQHGLVFKELLRRYGDTVLFVSAAGNDHDEVSATISSPANFAGLALGADNVIVVGSHDPTGARSDFSNTGQDIEAPGEQILSTVPGDTYRVYCGTSMSTPFVSGLAGYLLAVDPGLLPFELKDLIMKAGPTTDGFTSVLEIDALPGHDREVLRKLLDIDDGTEDGNERVAVGRARLEVDRSFEEVTGADIGFEDADGDGGRGDGVIDMSDFRRWRDWLLFGSGVHALNGSPANLKNDANGDGLSDPTTETKLYPRGDFNGDGAMSLTGEVGVPGYLEGKSWTDLGVLIASGLWTDRLYTDPTEIHALVNSVDITVSAENFFQRYGDVDELHVAPRDLAGDPIAGWDADRRVLLTKDEPVRLITVPVETTIYIASDEIELEDDTKILARSIGDVTLELDDRGADLAVDLVRIELSGLANTQNPELEEIDSEPQQKEVDAVIGATEAGVNPEALTHGCRAWANDEGTLYTVARSGRLETPPDDETQGTTFESEVRWQRSFVKVAGAENPKFLVKPMKLGLAAGADYEFTAFAEISIEMRAYDISSAWQPVFLYRAEIAGKIDPGVGHSYYIVGQEGYPPPEDGGLAPVQLKLIGTPPTRAEYIQKKHKGEIDLEGVAVGHSFEVRYLLTARAYGAMLDGLAEAYIGDPLDYGSGIRMSYGDFGELPRIDDITFDSSAGALVAFTVKEGFYAILYRNEVPVAVALTEAGANQLVDPDPAGASAGEYTLEYQPVDAPLDLDGDGIDDLYELAYAGILDPLDPNDARLDADGDARSNLLEYEEGTDPTVPDAEPRESEDIFPARIFDPGVPNAAIGDVNDDGIADLIGIDSAGVTVALGIEGGGFEVPLTSESPAQGFFDASVFTDLDGDGSLDIVVSSLLEDRVQVLLGDGLGGFAAGGTFATGRSPQRLASADVNGDGIADVLAANSRGHSVSVLLGVGDGSLEDAVDTELELSADPRDATAADMDGDGVLDLVVGVQQGFLVSILPGNGDGTFGAQRNHPAAFIITRIDTGDVNGDGALDVVTTSGTTHLLSVFLGNGDGTLRERTDYSTGRNPADFRLADLDGDGDLDIVVGHSGDPHHGVLLGRGDGTFAIHTPAYTTASGSCLLADFTGDGLLDLLSPGYFISAGLPGGRFDTRVDVRVEGMYATELTLADINGDDWMDVALPNRNNHSVEVLLGAAGGAFTHSGTVPVGENLSKLVAADLNGDAAIDLAVITERPDFFPRDAQNRLHALLGDGRGGFTAQSPIDLAARPTDIAAGDVDGDGLDDVLVVYSAAGSIAPFINQGGGQLAPGELVGTGSVLGVSLGDLNGDGRDDVIVSASGGAPRVLLGDASGGLVERDNAVTGGQVGLSNIRLHDVTGDGVLDLVGSISLFNAGTRVIYHPGNGDGGFAAEEPLAEGVGGDLRFLSIADIDGDGRDDISTGRVFRLADPAGGWFEDQTYWSATQTVYDIDRDGRPDRLAVSGNALEVLFQRS